MYNASRITGSRKKVMKVTGIEINGSEYIEVVDVPIVKLSFLTEQQSFCFPSTVLMRNCQG